LTVVGFSNFGSYRKFVFTLLLLLILIGSELRPYLTVLSFVVFLLLAVPRIGIFYLLKLFVIANNGVMGVMVIIGDALVVLGRRLYLQLILGTAAEGF
jgi:hypothetical protein